MKHFLPEKCLSRRLLGVPIMCVTLPPPPPNVIQGQPLFSAIHLYGQMMLRRNLHQEVHFVRL